MCTGCAPVPVLVSHAGATLIWHSARGGFGTECTRSGTQLRPVHCTYGFRYRFVVIPPVVLRSIRRGKGSYTTVTVSRIGFGRVGVRNLSHEMTHERRRGTYSTMYSQCEY